MNIKDRERMDEFGDKINNLDKKIQGIYDALLDDERTSKIGLISEVEQMSKDLQVIMSAYKVGKWLLAIIVAMFLSLIGHTFKNYI
tara:strand:- start:525 stop:782 length:258 start_codon:yes stop_codon:yes gene_type:complete